MAMKHQQFTVAMADPDGGEPTEHVVTIILVDQLRAELDGKKYGIDSKLKMHTAALWAWAAMTRLELYKGKFGEFQSACLGLELYAPDGPADSGVDVDPTQPEASDD